MPLTLDFAAAANQPFVVQTIPTASWITVELPANDISFRHMAKQGGGVLDSDAEDKVIMVQGDNAAPVADASDGVKTVFWPGDFKTFRGADIRATADGKHVVQLRATGHSVALALLVGTLDLRGR